MKMFYQPTVVKARLESENVALFSWSLLCSHSTEESFKTRVIFTVENTLSYMVQYHFFPARPPVLNSVYKIVKK